MNTWDQLNEWLATAIVASLTWAVSVISPGLPPAVDGGVDQRDFMVGWAQQADQPPIEQVGEGTGDDLEILDEGAPIPDDVQLTDQETLDAGSAPAAQDGDIELLDQGAPPAATDTTVSTVYVAPVADTSTTYVAPEPVVATDPVLPEGFGTGRVHAVAGRSGIPPGLADCHVGAVTGRAYVGIDCGEDEGSSFVGHAPSFEEFPFVVEADFPFEGDEAFFTEANFPFGDDAELAIAADDDGDDTDVFVSAGGGARDRQDDETAAPVIETSGESSVQLAQRARDREPRARGDDRDGKRGKGSDKDRQREDDGAASEERTAAESREKDDRGENGNDDQVNADNKEKESKDKKDKKKRADRKAKKDRQREGR